MAEEKEENIMREQKLENKAENDKRMPEANCSYTLKTCGEERINRETCMDISAGKKLFERDESIKPTRLREMINKEINDSIKRINNSIKDAMQTFVICSMEEKKPILSHFEELKEISDMCRFRKEHCKKSSNVCIDQQTISYVSRRCNNPSSINLSTYDNSYLCRKIRESAIPLPIKNKISNGKKSKQHSKSANIANTDNCKITGNANTYICSETNNNNQDGTKSRAFYMDTNSNTITEQSNWRSTSASTTSSCKLINSIKEKRNKLLIRQSPNFSHEKSNDDNTVRDSRILRYRISRKEMSEMGDKQEVNIKVNAENVSNKDMTLSTKDGRYCKDMDDIDLQQDLSYSTVPCSSLKTYDNTRCPPSWISINSSKAKTKLNDSNGILTKAICTDVEQRDRKNNDRNNVRGDDNEYTMCHAVDDNRWLPKSMYTNCSTYDEGPKECFANSCKYRNKILQESVINQNGMRKMQTGYNKILQQPLKNYQREQVIRKQSTCSCIVEEEKDYCKGIDTIEKLPENVCNVVECLEKVSICRIPSKKLAQSAVDCKTSFNALGKHFEKTCKESAKHSEGVCGTKFENSKITRICKEFIAKEFSEDITVCKTMFGESNGLVEEAIINGTAFPDSKDTSKETICKNIPDSNFVNQNDVNRLSLNDIKDKLARENINNLNLNDSKENAGNKRIVKLNNKHDNNTFNNFTRQSANIDQHEQIKKIVNNQSKNLHQISIESVKDFKPLSKDVYSTTLRAQLYDHSNFALNSNVKKTSKTLINQQRMLSLNRSMRNHSQRSNNLTQNLASNKNNQLIEKIQKKWKEEEERQNISKEIRTREDKQKEPLLRRPFKKLIDVIRRGRKKTVVADRIETENIEARKIADGKKDNEKSEVTSKTENKTDDIKDEQEMIKKVVKPIRSPEIKIANEGKEMNVRKTDQTMPKLLRIIAAKKSHVLPTIITSKAQESEVVSVPAKIITTAHVNQEKILEEKLILPEVLAVSGKIITTAHANQEQIPEEKVILQEHTPVEITKEIKADNSIVEMSITTIEASVEDTPKDVVDEDEVLKDIRDKKIKIVPCPQRKPKEELQKLIFCKCGLPSDLSAYSYSITKCVKDVSCPQKKLQEEPEKSRLFKRELAFDSNKYLCSIVKCTKCNNIIEDCPCKDNRYESRKIYCAHCHLSTIQRTCAPYLKSCLRIDKPKFHDVSPLEITSHICTNSRRAREERKCKKAAAYWHSHEECRRRWCTTRGDYSRINDKRKYGSQANCINCGKSRNRCCATFALVKCHKIKEGCNRKGTMICLYCDNPQDKCTCRAPIGKCSHCGLPSNVYNCREDEGHAREQIATSSNENRTIRVTNWKPKREIEQYFTGNFEDFQSYSSEKCQCYEKSEQYPELSYQQQNIFSEVMNELQQKMSEPVCCARCWRNPCCCGSLVDQDKRKEERKTENRVKYIKESLT